MTMLTILLASYNYARYLPESLPLILGQLGATDELIVIDDASTDNSLACARAICGNDARVRIIANRQNQGVHAALASGLALASGRYILFAAADDCLLPGFAVQALNLLERHPESAFCTAPVVYVDGADQHVMDWPGPPLRQGAYYSQDAAKALMRRYGFWFCANSTVFRLDMLRAEAEFSPEMGNMADSFTAQVLALRHGFCALAEPMARVRLLPESYSCRERWQLERPYHIRVAVVRRMRELPELFAADFIDEWVDVWSFLDGLKAWHYTILKQQLLFLGKQRQYYRMRSSWPDLLFVPVMQFMVCVQFFIYCCWGAVLLCRYRLFWRYLKPGRLFPWLRKQFAAGPEQRSGS